MKAGMNHKIEETQIKYGNAASKLFKAANVCFGLEIPSEYRRIWIESFRVLYWVDHTIDGIGEFERNVFAQGLSSYLSDEGANQFYPEIAVLFKKSLYRLDDPIRRAYINYLLVLYEASEKVRHAQCIDDLISSTRLEGEMTAGMLLKLLPVGLVKNVRYLDYGNWLRNVGKVANLIDTLLDLKDDYEQGLVTVSPSMFNRGKIFIAALSDLTLVFCGLKVSFILKDVVYEAIRYVVNTGRWL